MKKLIIIAALLAAPTLSSAADWKVIPDKSKIEFATMQNSTKITGSFKKFDGKITSSEADFSDLQATISVDVNGINTDNEKRDGHLKSDDFFNAAKFPSITFKSTGIKNLGDKNYILIGELTIRDVTKEVSIPVVYGGTVKDPYGNIKAGFKATGTINRQEYGLKWKAAAATGEAVVSDDVNFTIDLILIKDEAKK